MAARETILEKRINASEVCTDPALCPVCKHGDVTIYGYVCVNRRELIQRFGKSTDLKSVEHKTGEGKRTETVEMLDCHICGRRFVVQRDKDWDTGKQISERQTIEVKASEVCLDRVECPKCKDGDVTLYGYVCEARFVYRERFEGGKSVDRKTSKFQDFLDSKQSIEILHCHTCRTRFVVQPDEDWTRAERYLSLEDQIAEIDALAAEAKGRPMN